MCKQEIEISWTVTESQVMRRSGVTCKINQMGHDHWMHIFELIEQYEFSVYSIILSRHPYDVNFSVIFTGEKTINTQFYYHLL